MHFRSSGLVWWTGEKPQTRKRSADYRFRVWRRMDVPIFCLASSPFLPFHPETIRAQSWSSAVFVPAGERRACSCVTTIIWATGCDGTELKKSTARENALCSNRAKSNQERSKSCARVCERGSCCGSAATRIPYASSHVTKMFECVPGTNTGVSELRNIFLRFIYVHILTYIPLRRRTGQGLVLSGSNDFDFIQSV